MGGTRQSMNVAVEDQNHGMATMVGQAPRAAFGVHGIDCRCGPAERWTFEHDHQSRSTDPANDGVPQSLP